MPEFTVIVDVRAGARTRGIHVNDVGKITVKTTTAPEKGKANKDVVDMLAEHFNVSKSHIILLKGHAAKRKIFKIIA